MYTGDNIIIISPDYMKGIRKLTLAYTRTDFYLFSNAQLALDEFMQIPFQYTIGLCYINDRIEKRDKRALTQLMKLLNIIGTNKQKQVILVFALEQTNNIKRLKREVLTLSKRKLNGSGLYLVPFKLLTEKVILRQAIGTILINTRPIELTENINVPYESASGYLSPTVLVLKGLDGNEDKEEIENETPCGEQEQK